MYITENYELSDFAGSAESTTLGFGAIFGGALLIIIIISLAVSALFILSMWKIFVKNGKKGWLVLIPFCNTWNLFEIVGMKGWLSLVPIANVICMLIVEYKLAIKMGKSEGFAVLTILFPYICLPILAFSKTTVNNTTNENNINTTNTINETQNNNTNNGPTNNAVVIPTIQNNVVNEPTSVMPEPSNPINNNVQNVPNINPNVEQSNTNNIQ